MSGKGTCVINDYGIYIHSEDFEEWRLRVKELELKCEALRNELDRSYRNREELQGTLYQGIVADNRILKKEINKKEQPND